MCRRIVTFLLCCSLIFTSAVPTFAAEMKRIPNTKVYADKQVVEAFDEGGFTLRYQKDMRYAGVFSMKRKEIVLKRADESTTLHEMGHFLSRLKNDAAQDENFQNIYRKEKKKYRGILKSYVTKNSSEYFAQSYADYRISPKQVKIQRPKTYAYMKSLLRNVQAGDIEHLMNRYCWPK